MGQVRHLHSDQHPAAVPAETRQVRLTLLGLRLAGRIDADCHRQGLGRTAILSVPSPGTSEILQRQAGYLQHIGLSYGI